MAVAGAMCSTCHDPEVSHHWACVVGGRDAAERAFRKSAEVSEKACPTCGRMNNVGVSKCWWCETAQ